MTRPRTKRPWKAVLLAAFSTIMFIVAPAPVHATADHRAAAATGYLNLHQCMYYQSGDMVTAVVPVPPWGSRNWSPGTNVSNTPDTTASCGQGGDFPLNSAVVKALDLTAGRYLNLHQCMYYQSGDMVTAVVPVPPWGSRNWSPGTNVSNTPDTTASCGQGGDFPLNSAVVKALDLTAGRYLNLHQCMYYQSGDMVTAVVPVPPWGSRNWSPGTNVSNTPDTTASCGQGGDFPLYSAVVKTLDLTAGR